MTFDEFDFEEAARVFAEKGWFYSDTGPRIVPDAAKLRRTVRELQELNERRQVFWTSTGRFIVFREPERIVCEATQPDEYRQLRVELDEEAEKASGK